MSLSPHVANNQSPTLKVAANPRTSHYRGTVSQETEYWGDWWLPASAAVWISAARFWTSRLTRLWFQKANGSMTSRSFTALREEVLSYPYSVPTPYRTSPSAIGTRSVMSWLECTLIPPRRALRRRDRKSTRL